MIGHRWSRAHERCRHCGRTDRPHGRLGLCTNCYSYHRDPAAAKAKRKAKRLENDTVAKRYPRVRAWHEAHAEEVRAYKRAWHKRTYEPKFPIGKKVWFKEGPWWLEGEIVERPNNTTIILKVRGSGRLVKTGCRWVRTENPNSEVVR